MNNIQIIWKILNLNLKNSILVKLQNEYPIDLKLKKIILEKYLPKILLVKQKIY